MIPRSHKPNSAPPKMQATLIRLMANEFTWEPTGEERVSEASNFQPTMPNRKCFAEGCGEEEAGQAGLGWTFSTWHPPLFQ